MSDSLKDGLERLGGETGIAHWMELFYDRVAQNPILKPIFPGDLSESRKKQTAYMIEFLGGPKRYTEAYGKPFLRFKHRHFRIGVQERDAWMEAFLGSMREVTEDAGLIAEMEAAVGAIATAMVNHHPEKKDAYYFN